ncbi:hypothetical protein J9253_05900 [Thiothrix litoralis]|jgi:hypothetical protein|uniref:Capsid protein n=1 Tax=Thiothrix litoralis TaxID=2891210 RepID=A0ABX7WV09_9GAMM|nr:hypothetical protein [Thiothrix litoralis]QTR47465.1 hypothetical protein J9253_05900 [Thiothrix litoralis]
MAVQRAPGFQDQKASGYIPEVWSGKWLHEFYTQTVASSITNTDFEGEIRGKGDKVIIPRVPDIQWAKYHKGQKLELTGKLESEPVVMDVNRAHYFMFVDDDVDTVQRNEKSLPMKAIKKSSINGAKRIDSELLCDLPFHVSPCNQGCEAGAVSGAYNLGGVGTGGCNPLELLCGGSDCQNSAINVLIDLMSTLEENDVPNDEGNLFVVIPQWLKNLVLKHPRFQDASALGESKSPLRNGKIGMIDGMEVYMSNLVRNYDLGGQRVFDIVAGHTSAITFATQLTKTESKLRSQETFGDIYRGLQVYDWMVTNPEYLALARVTKG